MNLELFFQWWRRISTDSHTHPPPLRLCLVRNDTHFREGWPGEEFSPRPSAERHSVTLMRMSHGTELQLEQAGQAPSLVPLKYAAAQRTCRPPCHPKLPSSTRLISAPQEAGTAAFSQMHLSSLPKWGPPALGPSSPPPLKSSLNNIHQLLGLLGWSLSPNS